MHLTEGKSGLDEKWSPRGGGGGAEYPYNAEEYSSDLTN